MSLLWQALCFFWLAGEVYIAIATRRRNSAGANQDRGSQLVLWIAVVLALTIAGFLRAWLPPQFHWHQPWIRPLSLFLLAVGLAVRAIAILTLGRWFTANVVTRPGQTLNRSGLYGVVRHASYLGMEIIFLAFGLHAASWPALLIGFIPPTLAVIYRIRVEEAALAAVFGTEYDQYRRQTSRLVPGLY
ncbi:MAG TPA: isoprenylcysteine carboxylmethyltransferase family protein [Terracidiphilus sp.]|jgi:protein-S-isoprenylcysteine O-methyltransferase Ste14